MVPIFLQWNTVSIAYHIPLTPALSFSLFPVDVWPFFTLRRRSTPPCFDLSPFPPPTSKTPATCAVARIFQLRWLRAKTVAVPLVSRLPGCDLNRNLHRDSAAVAISPRQPQEGIVSTRQQVFWISCEPPSKMMILLRLPRTLCARIFPHQASARKADRH